MVFHNYVNSEVKFHAGELIKILAATNASNQRSQRITVLDRVNYSNTINKSINPTINTNSFKCVASVITVTRLINQSIQPSIQIVANM